MISFYNLKQEYYQLKKNINTAINRVLNRGLFLIGPELTHFEIEFARFVGTKFAIGVNSGHDALKLSLKVLNINPEDQILVAANAYPTAMAIADYGAYPIPVDIDSDLQLDLNSIEVQITSRTKALIAVHLFGIPEKILALKALCRRHKLLLIEDCAQAHGCYVNKRHVGNFGILGCFSFYPTKNLGSYGDGGMIVTNNSKLAGKLRQLRQYGEINRYHSLTVSGHSRLNEIQAAILRVKLKHLLKFNHQRQKLALFYRQHLPSTITLSSYFQPGYQSAFHQFIIRVNKRDQLQQYLQTYGVPTQIHYPITVPQIKSLANYHYQSHQCRQAQKAAKQILSLPIHPFLSQPQIAKICQLINKFIDRYGNN